MRKVFIVLILGSIILCGCKKSEVYSEENSIFKCMGEMLGNETNIMLDNTSYIIISDQYERGQIVIKDKAQINGILSYIKSSRECKCKCINVTDLESFLSLNLYDVNDNLISQVLLHISSDIGYLSIKYLDSVSGISIDKYYYIDGNLFESVFSNFIGEDTH